MTHARLSPSNHRWVHCPGSVREESGYQDISSAAAIDGTGSHELLEQCLINGVRAEQYDGQIVGVGHHDQPLGWMVGPDRIERVQMCLDYVIRRVEELKRKYPGAEIAIQAESQSDPGGAFGRDDWKGTADITITVVQNDKCLFIEIVDYKDGRGWVSEKNNTQLISYAFGKCRPFIASGPDLVRPFRPEAIPDGVRMTIVQPKTNPVVRYQDMSTHDLVKKAEELGAAAHATDNPDAMLSPGKHCEWCKANPKRGGHCTADSQQSMEVMKTMGTDIIATDGKSLFEVIDQVLADVKSLTPDQLADLADARAGIEAAFDKVDTEITSRLESGESVPGYAMKPGRGQRVWSADAETIEKKLRSRKLKAEDIFPKKLASPAQILGSDKLTDDQKQKIEKELMTFKAGALKLTKVGRGSESVEKTVAQSSTDVSQLFAGVKKEPTPSVFADSDAEAEQPTVSFM